MPEFKAFNVHDNEGQVSARIEHVKRGECKPGEVLVRVEYSSVNYKDALAATGKGKIIRNFPRIPGIDAAGIVEASASEKFKVGTNVLVTGYEFGTGVDGGYAELAYVPAEWLVTRPDNLDAKTAMILGTAGFTAAMCIQRMEQNGQHPSKGPIVISGATGGVGMLAVNMLSGLGYEVVAISGKPEQDELLVELGASEVLRRQDLNLDTPPLAKGQWGGAIDNVGGDMLAWLLSTVMPWGNIASVGLAGGSHLHSTVNAFYSKRGQLTGHHFIRLSFRVGDHHFGRDWRMI